MATTTFSTPNNDHPSPLPPLIEREIFFDDPEISGGQLSPDGSYISFLKVYKGMRNIWVKKTDAPFENARPITADNNRPIPGYIWSRDGKYVLFVQDDGGDENFNVYAVDPESDIDPETEVPLARNLTPMKGVRAIIYSVPKNLPDVLFVGLNQRDSSWHDLFRVNIRTGELNVLRENTQRIGNWIFDLKDELRLATRSTEDGGMEILRVDEEAFVPIYRCSFEESCSVVKFHKDHEKVYIVSNKGQDIDLTQLLLLDPHAGTTELVESDPDQQVDFGDAYFSELTNELIATSYESDKTKMYWRDEAFKKDYEFLKSQLPAKEVMLGSSSDDEEWWIIYANSDVDPGAAYLFDRKTRQLTFQYRPRPKLPIDHLAPMYPVRYPSKDGLSIPAYLTLPKNIASKQLPAIIYPHGGPWVRDYWGYDAFTQFLANRGYAVLQPNFRGSAGYGKRFLNAGNGKWGEEMQDDLSAGVDYLINEGIADPSRIGIFGGSYGGYATLAGLAFTPDLYAAGVSVVGPSNLITLLESIPPYWESVRQLFYKRTANLETEEGRAKLVKQSPLFSANQIRASLMVVQGANDPRVKKAESDQIVIAMRNLGLPVTYLVAEDEGHGFRKPINNLALVAAMEKFLAEHLGGRYQETLKEDIRKKLDELTVDIYSVELSSSNNELK